MDERVRAVLITPEGRMLTIRRKRPGGDPYWVLPGGGIEQGDGSLRDALERELREELGGTARVDGFIRSIDSETTREHIYLARIDAWDQTARSGPEFNDPTLETYDIDLLPFTAEAVSAIDLKPEEFAQYLINRLAESTNPSHLPVDEHGRIWFPGNPWPNGHRLTDARWTADLRPETGLWWHLHLETAEYDDEGWPDEPTSGGDWTSPGTWQNYHSCRLSSAHWPGDFPGILAVPNGQHLALRDLDSQVFRADNDPGPAGSFDPAFGIYLTGHDSVADHELRFQHQDDGRFSLVWTGRVALSYAGDDDFDYSFHAQIRNLHLDRIGYPDHTEPADALALLCALLEEGSEFEPGMAELAPGYGDRPALVRRESDGLA